MKLQILSDLHLEFHKDLGDKFIEQLDPTDVDVLIIAGDLIPLAYGDAAIKSICDKYKKVLYVLGNHEFYGSTLKNIKFPQHKNLKILNNKVVEIEGRRFIGSTLWFPKTELALKLASWLSDFTEIASSNKIFLKNKQSIDFLKKNMKPDDIVITHHLPSAKLIKPPFENSLTNCFFMCELDELIEEKKPLLWVHGHSHSSCDIKIADTYCVRNPLGYWNYEYENPEFNRKMIIEV